MKGRGDYISGCLGGHGGIRGARGDPRGGRGGPRGGREDEFAVYCYYYKESGHTKYHCPF